MSTFLQKRKYEDRALELQLLNQLISSHDLCCGCEKPLDHITYLCINTFDASNPKIQQTKCLLFGETTGETADTKDAVDALFDGELEELFAQDVTEDDQR